MPPVVDAPLNPSNQTNADAAARRGANAANAELNDKESGFQSSVALKLLGMANYLPACDVSAGMISDIGLFDRRAE